MKKLSCLIGIIVIFCDSLAWGASSAISQMDQMTAAEFGLVFLVGMLLVLPELVFQIREFITSGGVDAPF